MQIINVSLAKAYEHVNSLKRQNSLTFQSKLNSLTFPDFQKEGTLYYIQIVTFYTHMLKQYQLEFIRQYETAKY